ncbi:hypothetical protein M6C35_002540 [Vibrio metschnikovii]|nr:hypothetical protein [Vibrio metschnikovii]
MRNYAFLYRVNGEVYDRSDFYFKNYCLHGYKWKRDAQFYFLIYFPFNIRRVQFERDTGAEFLSDYNLKGTNFHKFLKNGGEEIRQSSVEKREIVQVDGVGDTGLLQGWIYSKSGKSVQIIVDGECVKEIKNNQLLFSYDLLVAGLFPGGGRFKVELPWNILDGSQKKVEIIDKDSNLLFEKRLYFPYLKKGGNSIFLHASPPELWESMRQKAIQDGSFESFKVFFDSDASCKYIVKDIGLSEYSFRLGLESPSFSDFLKNRNKLYFDSIACTQSVCCKSLPFEHNKDVLSNQSYALNFDEIVNLDCPVLYSRNFASKKFTNAFCEKYKIPSNNISVIKSIEDFRSKNMVRYVLKPEFDSGKNIFLVNNGVNVLTGEILDNDVVENMIKKSIESKRYFIYEDFLVQEVMPEDAAFIPFDYKFHCFGGKARFVTVYDRILSLSNQSKYQRTYSRDFSRTIDGIRDDVFSIPVINKPHCYDDMLEIVDYISTMLDDYLRIDMYATNRGPVLGEITTYHNAGNGFNELFNRIMIQLWHVYNARSQY